MVLGDMSAIVICHLSHPGLTGPGKGPSLTPEVSETQVLLELDSARWVGKHQTLSVHVSLCRFMPDGGAGVIS